MRESDGRHEERNSGVGSSQVETSGQSASRRGTSKAHGVSSAHDSPRLSRELIVVKKAIDGWRR